jgi:thioredoxin-related protein
LRLNNQIKILKMKKLIVLLALVSISCMGNAQKKAAINWMTLEEAVAAQAKEPRKIIMDMYTTWCGPCKMLDKNTFHNEDVANYINKNYYAVKFNAEGNEVVKFKDRTFTNPNYDPAKAKRRNSGHQLAGYFRVQGYPTIVFLDEKADLITPLIGYKNPNQLELYLTFFATRDLKKTTKEDWQQYQKDFKPTFKI